MKVKAYIYFPDTDVALDSLGQNEHLYTELVRELNNIKLQLKGKDYELYYDSGNISSFVNVAEGLMDNSYLNSIRTQLRIIIGNKSKDVNLPVLRNNNCVYANWIADISVFSAPFVVSEACEAKRADNEEEKTCCICLGNSLDTQREEIHVIKDLPYDASLPDLTAIDAVNSDIGFVKWLTTIPVGKFSLKYNSDFEPLDKRWKKERIYRHKNSGQYWYFDFFHRENKVHYEVFDHVGNHFGEADSDGKINTAEKSDKKKISNLL